MNWFAWFPFWWSWCRMSLWPCQSLYDTGFSEILKSNILYLYSNFFYVPSDFWKTLDLFIVFASVILFLLILVWLLCHSEWRDALFCSHLCKLYDLLSTADMELRITAGEAIALIYEIARVNDDVSFMAFFILLSLGIWENLCLCGIVKGQWSVFFVCTDSQFASSSSFETVKWIYYNWWYYYIIVHQKIRQYL